MTEGGVVRFMVIESHEGKGHWDGMENWDKVMREYQGDASAVIRDDPGILPEDNAIIIFTSGTTGLPSKLANFRELLPLNPFFAEGVLSTQRMILTTILNVSIIFIVTPHDQLPLRLSYRRNEGSSVGVTLSQL